MKILLTKLSTKDLATLAQRIISSSQSGKYPVITNHPLVGALQTSYAECIPSKSIAEKEKM